MFATATAGALPAGDFTAAAVGFALCPAGAAFFAAAALAAGLAAAFAGAFLAIAADAAGLVAAGFFTVPAFLAARLLVGLFDVLLPALALATFAGFDAGFFAASLPGADFLTGATFFAGALLLAIFFAGALPLTFFAAGAATFLAAGLTVLAGLLPTLFTARPFGAATLELAARASFALVADLLFCAFAAVELRVVFAISLHRCWPWRPGVIAHVTCTSKHTSGILVPLQAADCFGNVNPVTRLILLLLRLYKRWLSPLLGTNCRFYPSCSDYARTAVTRFGPWRGSMLVGWRLLRCQPLCSGGIDPVPQHFHYPRCHCRRDPADQQ